MGKRFWAGMTKMWVLVLTPALPLTGYVTLGRLFHFQCCVLMHQGAPALLPHCRE